MEVRSLLFADDLVLLSASETELQRALERFAALCAEAGMVISVSKSEAMVLSRKPAQCALHVSGATLKQVEKFKYLGVWFTSEGRDDTEIATRVGRAGAIMRELGRSVVRKAELSRKAKLSVFHSMFFPTLIYRYEHWVVTEKTRSRVQAAEMRFLRGISGVTRLEKVRNSEIRKGLNVEPLLLRIEKSQLHWFGHVVRMPQLQNCNI